ALPADPSLSPLAGRQARHDALDALVEGWTATRDRWEVTRALQAAGVAAAPVCHSKDLLFDPHLRARGYFRRTPMGPRAEGLDKRVQLGPAWRLEKTPVETRRGAPTLGEDNREVWTRVLGRSPAELERDYAAGVIGDTPAAHLLAPPSLVQSVPEQVAGKRAYRYDPDYKEQLAAIYGPE